MSNKELENVPLDEAELEQVSGGMYWTGSGWVDHSSVSSSSVSGTHNGIGFTSLNSSSSSGSLPSWRAEIQGNQRVIIGNKGKGEYVIKKLPV